jgi:metal-responsive CopG/Arc/MetJ family transcriptional regulator
MKVVISVPDPIFEAAELLARQRHVPRSQLITEALREYISRHGSVAVTAKLNEVYGSKSTSVEPALAQAQYASIPHEAW